MKLVATVAFALAFCCSAAVAQSLEQQREIVAKKAVTLGDACLFFHGIHAGANESTALETAFEKLVELGVAPVDWKDRLGDQATLGDICVLICATLNVRGGITARLFGMSPRLAYKECARAQLVRRAGPHSAVSGYSLQGIAGKVQDLLEK